MNKVEKDKLRSSVLYKNETLKVRYVGEACNFSKGKIIDAIPRFVTKSGLPYPKPKWVPSCYFVTDLDGELFEVAQERYGKIYEGFEWVI